MSESIFMTLAATVIAAIALSIFAKECFDNGYDKGIEHGRLLERGMQDVKAGRVHDQVDVFAELDKELNDAT